MEKKSIGTFIAILRRVNGMTQKDLADKLMVSDKTVSHWERDESAPDLTLVPVIAEVFGVTCDELLRGERIKDASEESSGKTDKQVRYLLDISRKKFRARSMVSLGLSILGLFAAMLFNFGHSGAYIAFVVGCIFYMFAAISESIFYSYALYAASGGDFDGNELNDYKMYVVRLAEKIMSVPAILLAASLALVVFPHSAGECIDAVNWLAWGLLAVPAAAVACIFVVYIVNNALVKKGVYTLVKSADIKRYKVFRLRVLCITVVAVILAALFAGQMVFDKAVAPEAFTEGITFNNLDDFKAYAEKGDINTRYQEDHYYGPRPTGAGADEYFDDYGNPVSKEQALADYIQRLTDYISDDAGNVVCQYVRLNRDVASISYSGAGTDKFSITVHTHEQWYAGQRARDLINAAWVGSYFIAAGVGLLIYFKKRVKLS